MKRGQLKWNGSVDKMEYIQPILKEFASMIVNEIKGKFPVYKSYDIMLSGGGVTLLEDSLSKLLDFEVVKDSVFANAIGFYNVGSGMIG